jgi:competence protein ComEC
VIPAAIAFLLGILCASHSYAVPVLALYSIFTLLRRGRGASLIALVSLALGIVDAYAGERAAVRDDRHFATLPVVVTDVQVRDGGYAALVVRLADGTLASTNVRDPSLSVGERLTLRAKREAFDDARNPGEPAERDIEAERGLQFRLVHARIIARASPDPGDISLWLPRARAWGSRRIHTLLGEPDATILAGAMWGERGTLPSDLRAEFQDTGTVHILVTAGLHLGVIAAIALFALGKLGIGRVGASLATIPVVWIYAGLSGAHLPSMRAATMLTFALVARATGRDAYSWSGLALAAIVIAALRPSAVTSLSFALSFSCVAAIFAFARPCTQWFSDRGTGHTIGALLGVAIATQIGTWPLTAYGFLVIAPFAPLANAVVVPVVGIAMIVGFAAILATPIPALAHAIANVAIALVDWIASAVRVVSQFPSAHIVATPPPIWTIVTYDASLVLLALALGRARFVRPALAVVACAAALCLWPPRGMHRALTITAIDVGQADSLLITTPSGHAFLVDGGGRLESGAAQNGNSQAEAIGERIVVPFLIRHGIHHLDAVLLSHPHGDHVGGFPAVLRTLGANAFADSGQAYPGHAYADALAVARERGIALREPRAGDVWRTDDGVTFRFYGPSLPYIAGGRNDINDNSLVFILEYEKFRMLFTGDAGELAERRLLASGADIHADILKVGHHGSAYGTTPAFVKAVHPTSAVISVGRHNLFGHPAPSTLRTLAVAGVRIYRTDRDGAVTITIDGARVAIQTVL